MHACIQTSALNKFHFINEKPILLVSRKSVFTLITYHIFTLYFVLWGFVDLNGRQGDVNGCGRGTVIDSVIASSTTKQHFSLRMNVILELM